MAALTEIQKACAGMARSKWGPYMDSLKESLRSLDEEKDEDRQEAELVKTLMGQLEAYTSNLPVLGFNSSKYDLNLVKSKLAKHLDLNHQEHGFTVKKANAYACIATHTFRFLDISHFLAPGTSYAAFLRAYRVEETKGFFPYEWFDDVQKLEKDHLPPKEAFYSSLKETGVSEENYAFCRTVWREKNMRTFRDFLEWYNNLDVKPFVEAVEKMQTFYFEKGIGVFKTAISVPGIARQMLFKVAREEGAEFSLVDEKNRDLYQTIKDNIVGGKAMFSILP